MDQIMNQIVKIDAFPPNFIDEDLLNKHTYRVIDLFGTGIPWGKVKHLYIIGGNNWPVQSCPTGIYVNHARDWVLVAGASAKKVQTYLERCADPLEQLCILDTEITHLDVHKLIGLKQLILKYNFKLDKIRGLPLLGQLEKFIMHYTAIARIVIPDTMKLLCTLNLRDNHELDSVYLQGQHPLLEELDISLSSVGELLIDQVHPKLTRLYATSCPLTDLGFLKMLPQLVTLYIPGASVTRIPSLGMCRCLETLMLASCPIMSLDNVKFPQSLRILHLRNTGIRYLPESLQNLKNLQMLNLSDLHLISLPNWLLDLGLSIGRNSSYGINLRGTTVDGIDMSIFDMSQAMIREWFEYQKSRTSVPPTEALRETCQESTEIAPRPLNELKVVFLGDGGAGKSHTIARLMDDGKQAVNFPNSSTPGIVIKDKIYDIGDRRIQIHFWDFGGQDILHSMHRMFLTERTLYVVMVNVRDGTQTDRARYWLYCLRSFAAGAPVLLVLNQMDTNHNASINITDLRAMYPSLTKEVKTSALMDDPEYFRANLIDALKEQIGALHIPEFSFIPSWSMLMEKLRHMPQYYIKSDEFERYCAECGVTDDERTRMILLQRFNELGVSFHYGARKLKDFVILRPDWITNAIYTIIFNKSDDVENGLISHDAIYDLLSSKSPEVRRAIPDMVYKKDEVDYVLDVIRKFRLSFQVGSDTEFIPTLCRADSLPIATKYELDPTTLEFRMEYEYLPNNVLHRLMVDLRRDLDTSQVWLTGALFKQKSNGLSAVVKSEGDVLRIFVKGENDFHKPHTYLNIIRDTLNTIHQDMGLTEPKALVVYKKDGKTEDFSYKLLIGTLKSGAKDVYSDTWDRMISVEDILNQTDREVERNKQQLLSDVAAACVRMQHKKICWDASEDDRNTELRDLLWSMNYHVADQSLAGVGAGGKRAGELDLLILTEQKLPWVICEALNVKGDTSSQLTNWDNHLNKLLVNYNTVGMQDVILISYVNATVDEFPKYWTTFSEHMRWYDPPKYPRRDGTYEVHTPTPEQYNCLRASRCTYDQEGMPITVHHHFLRMGL